MNIKPIAGLKVRDPDLRDYLPESGRVVPDTSYWRRRLRDGSVEVVPPVPSATVAPGKPAPVTTPVNAE